MSRIFVKKYQVVEKMSKLLVALIAVAAVTAFNSEDAEARGSCYCSYRFGDSGNYSPETRGGDEPGGTRKAGKCLEMCKKRSPHPDAVNAARRATAFNPNSCTRDATVQLWVLGRVTGTNQDPTAQDRKSYTIYRCKKCPSGYERTPNTGIDAKNACRRIQYTNAQ